MKWLLGGRRMRLAASWLFPFVSEASFAVSAVSTSAPGSVCMKAVLLRLWLRC